MKQLVVYQDKVYEIGQIYLFSNGGGGDVFRVLKNVTRSDYASHPFETEFSVYRYCEEIVTEACGKIGGGDK